MHRKSEDASKAGSKKYIHFQKTLFQRNLAASCDGRAYVRARNTARGVDLLTKRVGLLELDDVISGDKYLFVRDVYLQRNRYLVNDGAIEDDFGDFGDFGDFEDY